MITIYTLVIVSILQGTGVHTTTMDFTSLGTCNSAADKARYYGNRSEPGQKLNTVAYCVERN